MLAPHAQGQQTAGLGFSLAPFVQLDSGSAPTAIANLNDGIVVAGDTPDLTGDPKSHTVTVQTNSSTGATLNLEINSAGGATSWDNVQLAVAVTNTATGNAPNAGTATSGSSSGTAAPRTCTADCTGPSLVTAIKGGEYTYTVQYTLSLTTRYALSGARNFSAIYTVTL